MVTRWLLVLVFMGSFQAFCQSDSLESSINPDSINRTTPLRVPGHHSPVLHHDVPFTDETSIHLQADQVPLVLRKTLQGKQYRGWESGMLLQNQQTGEFKLEMVHGEETKNFYFNRNGERVSD